MLQKIKKKLNKNFTSIMLITWGLCVAIILIISLVGCAPSFKERLESERRIECEEAGGIATYATNGLRRGWQCTFPEPLSK